VEKEGVRTQREDPSFTNSIQKPLLQWSIRKPLCSSVFDALYPNLLFLSMPGRDRDIE
jgi:hypothetical protein